MHILLRAPDANLTAFLHGFQKNENTSSIKAVQKRDYAKMVLSHSSCIKTAGQGSFMAEAHTVIPQLLPRDLLEGTTDASLPHHPWKPGLTQGSGREVSFHVSPPHVVKASPGCSFRALGSHGLDVACIYPLHRQEQLLTTTPPTRLRKL